MPSVAHRSYNLQDVRSANPSYNCTIGNYYYRYDTYTGSDDYTQVCTLPLAFARLASPLPLAMLSPETPSSLFFYFFIFYLIIHLPR